MTSERHIDLGELPRDEASGALWMVPHGGWCHAWLRPRVRRWRRWCGGLAAMALLVALPAGAPPASPWAEHRFTIAGEPLHLGADTIYVVRSVEPARQVLAAHRLDDGAHRWEITRDVGRATSQSQGTVVMRHGWFTVAGGVPMHVASLHIQRDGDFHPAEAVTTAFDPATGRPLWIRYGAPIGEPSGDLLVLEQQSPDRPLPRVKSAIDLGTGETVWSMGKGAGLTQVGGAHLVAIDNDGNLTSYDRQTGTRLASTSTGQADWYAPQVTNGLVLLRRFEGPDVVALAADTLTPRWRAPVPPDSSTHGCHHSLCVQGPQGVTILDPVTGAEQWSFDWPEAGLGRRVVRDLPPPWPPGWLVLYAIEADTGTERTVLVDSGNGAVVMDLDGWRPVLDGQPGALVTRVQATGRTWFGRVVVDPPGIETLGSIPLASWCHATDRHLACQAGSQVEVWQLRRGGRLP